MNIVTAMACDTMTLPDIGVLFLRLEAVTLQCLSDCETYRNHCRNKTHRLRSGTKMTHGKGKEFKKLPAVSLDNTKTGQYVLRTSSLASFDLVVTCA